VAFTVKVCVFPSRTVEDVGCDVMVTEFPLEGAVVVVVGTVVVVVDPPDGLTVTVTVAVDV
jgi:hypothetical protein